MTTGTQKPDALPVGTPWAVGQVREVLFHLSTVDVVVECLVLDTRKVYGRTEYQITPVSGRGDAWVQEKGRGPTTGGKAWQERHRKGDDDGG